MNAKKILEGINIQFFDPISRDVLIDAIDRELYKTYALGYDECRKQNSLTSRVVKPPIGLIPRDIHAEQRINAIVSAIGRYAEVGLSFPKEWAEELRDLTKDSA